MPEARPPDSPVRVVRVVTRMNIGGPSIHVALLSGELDPRRFATCLVVGTPDAQEGDALHLVDRARARLVVLRTLRRALHPLRDLWSLWRLLRLLWRERPQIIHTHMAKAGALGRAAGKLYNLLGPGRRAPAALVHTFHGHVLEGYFFPHVTRLFITIEQRLAKWSDRLIAVSPAVKRDLIDRRIAPSEKIAVIPLGLPLEPLLALNGFEAQPASRPLTIAWVGRLVPIKRPDMFVRGLALFHRADPARAWQAVIVGEGERRGEAQAAAEREGVDGRIRFLGWVRQVAPVYGQADVVCLTSANEGTPVALIEAMAAARPVIATGVGGVLDLLQVSREAMERLAPGQCLRTAAGWVIRSGDDAGLAKALDECAADPARRREAGLAAREAVRDRYAAGRLVRDIAALYETLLERHKEGGASCAC